MKRIGVLSDTHLRGYDQHLQEIVSRHFADTDLIIHAGDMVHTEVLDVFHGLGKDVVAVCGNMDGPDVRAAYPLQRVIQVEGVSIGITHGWGSPAGLRQRIRNGFTGVDAIVYGHSHEGFAGMEAGIFFFNPGSPTDSRFTTDRTVGIITVHDGIIKGDLIAV